MLIKVTSFKLTQAVINIEKNYVSVNPQFVFININIWSFRLPHLYIWMFCFRYHEYCFFHFSLVHIFYLHFRTLIEIETWCVKTSGAETEFKFDAWKSRWQVLIGFQFCNTHTWFHQTFLSQRNLETFMYHYRKETERKKTAKKKFFACNNRSKQIVVGLFVVIVKVLYNTI